MTENTVCDYKQHTKDYFSEKNWKMQSTIFFQRQKGEKQ